MKFLTQIKIQITQKFSPRLQSFAKLAVGLLPIMLVLFLLPEDIAWAQTPVASTNILNETFAKLTSIFKIAMEFLATLLWPILLMIGGLLQNDILFSGGMEDRMRMVWIEVRNLVNVLFVVALLGLALVNVLGVMEDKIKSLLPKMIVAIIAVNFTFLAAKVILDVANVLTVSIFSIPQSIDPKLAQIQPTSAEAKKDFQAAVCRSIYPPDGATAAWVDNFLAQQAKIDANKTASTSKTTSSKAKANTTASKKNTTNTAANNKQVQSLTKKYQQPNSKQRKTVEDGLICKGLEFQFEKIDKTRKTAAGKSQEYFEKLFSTYAVNNSALAMALNLQKTYDIKQVQIPGQFSQFTLNIIFSLILFIIYSASYIALFAVLVVRVLVLWIAIAMSPLIIFSTKVGGINIPGLTDKIDQGVQSFIDHVTAPIIIAVTMTIGFILLKSFQGADHNNVTLQATGFLSQKTQVFNLPTSGLNTFKELLIAIATCGIVWLGVFQAAGNTLAAGFTDGLKNMLSGIGKFILTSPKYLPIIPIRTSKDGNKPQKVPLSAVFDGFSSLDDNLRSWAYDKSKPFLQSLNPFSSGAGNIKVPKLGGGTNEREALLGIKNTDDKTKLDRTELRKAYRQRLGFYKVIEKLKAGNAQQKAFYNQFQHEIKGSGQIRDPKFLANLKLHTNAHKAMDPTTTASTTSATTPTGNQPTPASSNSGSIAQVARSDAARIKNLLTSAEQKEYESLKKLASSSNAADQQKLKQKINQSQGDSQKVWQKVSSLISKQPANYAQNLKSGNDSTITKALKAYAQVLRSANLATPDQLKALFKYDLQKNGVDANKQTQLIDDALK